jgi:hypothetical protein
MAAAPIFEGYYRELTKLKLWYVRWLMRNEGMAFEDAIESRVNLRRMAGLAADPEGWQRLTAQLKELFERRAGDADTEALEQEGLQLMWPYMAPLAEREQRDAQEFVAQGSCFRYEYANYYADPDAGLHLTLHFGNAFRPDSPLRHLPELARELRKIIARAAEERPEVEWVQCASWLNSVPAFAGLFPPSWTAVAVPGPPGLHAGWWGQMQSRQGGFNGRNAAHMRAGGQFPYRHMRSHCPIAELREHLDRLEKQ